MILSPPLIHSLDRLKIVDVQKPVKLNRGKRYQSSPTSDVSLCCYGGGELSKEAKMSERIIASR
jgi:hypothetical protein